MRRQVGGFTLIEMLISISIMGLLLTVMAGQFSKLTSLQRTAEKSTQAEINRTISEGMLNFASNNNNGSLPDPFTGGIFFSGVTDPDDNGATSLVSLLLTEGVTVKNIVTNGKSAQAQRVYQKVSNIEKDVLVGGQIGPKATIQYDVGILYNTVCVMDDASCHPNSVTGIAGESDILTPDNLTTFVTTRPDYAPVIFSTYENEVRLVEETIEKINTLRDALKNLYSIKYLSGPPDPTINHFPFPDFTATADLSGQDPSLNENCRDGWYNLLNPNVNILEQTGLNQQEFGVTAWGARIEYCRDYDIGGASGADQPPHNAAVRIHQEVSRALAPNASGGNLVFGL